MSNEQFKLTIHLVASLDGMIAKNDNSTSWFETADHYENGITVTDQDAGNFLKKIDCYVMGARTYEHALELSKVYGWVYGDTPAIVLSHRPLPVERSNVEIFAGSLDQLVEEKLKPKYKNVWMAGGAMLAKEFIRAKLADEISISVMPVILGNGLQLFDNIGVEQALYLKNVIPYKSGMVELLYKIKK